MYYAIGSVGSIMPPLDATIWLDSQIPIVPEMLWVYLSCYLMPLYLVFVTKDWHRFNIVLLTLVFAHLLAFAVYMNFPVVVQKPELGQSSLEQALSTMYSLELKPSMNNLPSLHVIFALSFALGSLGQSLTRLGESLVFAWAFLIAASTLFIMQHIILDVVSAFIVASLSWLMAQYAYRRLSLRTMSPQSALLQLLRHLRLWILGGITFLLVLTGLHWITLTSV